jgi:hypothetical protein
MTSKKTDQDTPQPSPTSNECDEQLPFERGVEQGKQDPNQARKQSLLTEIGESYDRLQAKTKTVLARRATWRR